MSRLPSLPTLRALESAARLQSYSAAARELAVTHSAISHRVRELESSLGCVLFERRGNEMRPTAEARRLAHHVRLGLGILESAFAAGPSRRSKSKKPVPQLMISAVPAFATRYLASRLPSFLAHAGVDVRVRASAEVVSLAPGGANVAIRYGEGTWPGVEGVPLPGDVMFAVCSPEYATRERLHGPNLPKRFVNAVKLGHAWQPWSPWLEAVGLDMPEPEVKQKFEDSDLLLRTCAAGEGIALARGYLAAEDLVEGRLVVLPLGVGQDPHGFHLLHRGGAKPSGFDEFHEWLAATMKRDIEMLGRLVAP